MPKQTYKLQTKFTSAKNGEKADIRVMSRQLSYRLLYKIRKGVCRSQKPRALVLNCYIVKISKFVGVRNKVLGTTRLVELIRSLKNQDSLKMSILNHNNKNVFLVKKIYLPKKVVMKIACLSLL